ncbi:hypothetical protein GCM10017673_16960 [Streptosporangium violaceochromogenes]|nr:hypothetical protein GCM10017673_16960 [Streptosporangium violaceochromogenes]
MYDSDASVPSDRVTSETPGGAVVVLATTEVAGLRRADGTLLDRLTGQLTGLSTGDVHVITRSGDVTHAPGGTYMIGTEGSRGLADDLRRIAGVARTATGPVAVLAGDLVAHTEALTLLLGHPGRGTAALVARGGEEPGPLRPPVRIEGGLVAAAGAPAHDGGRVAGVPEANGTFRGALQAGADDLLVLAATAETLADLAEVGRFGSVDGAEAVELLLSGLIRAGVTVRAVRLGRLGCDRVAGRAEADEAVRRLGRVSEARARLRAAVKSDDGFFATCFVSSWSPQVVRVAARLGLTPNAVTGASAGLALLAAIWFSAGTRPAQLAGAALLYLSFVLDCVDGQLARYTGAFSPLGAWLDAIFDRVKEYVVYVGLAVGYTSGLSDAGGGPDGVWALAVAAMILQALRHTLDFSYAGARADAVARRLTRTADSGAPGVPADVAARPGGSPGRSGQAAGGEGPAGPAHDGSRGAAPGSPGPRGAWGRGRAPAAGEGGGTGDRPAGAAGAGNWVVRLSGRLERTSLTRRLKKIIVLPIGERMALIAVTAALFNARVTFIALLGWGSVAALYTLGGRIGRSVGR